ncbi:hypothetical protein AVEN_88506-1 [Araneus ventricosus]|uniref:Uncharacterized protein n=1 Tax=Araneus ventricosus TaxID=182803 RepID=A0A4Y2HQX4_ARAVE|nr:hypothetical protein AVEN_88506-1 [Araneus ventricosus]
MRDEFVNSPILMAIEIKEPQNTGTSELLCQREGKFTFPLKSHNDCCGKRCGGDLAALDDVSGDIVYIWMLPSALCVFTCMLAPAQVGSFATKFNLQRIQLLCFLKLACMPSEHVNVGFSLL